MKTLTFNDLVFQVFVTGLLVLLAGYLAVTLLQIQMPLSWGLPINWLREAFHNLVYLPLLHFAS